MKVLTRDGELVQRVFDKEAKGEPVGDISAGTLDMVARLGLRSRKVARITRLLSAGLAVASFTMLLASIAMRWASPESVSIGSVDIPNVLLAYFDDPRESSLGGSTVPFVTLADSLSDIAPFVGGAAMIVGVITAVVTRSLVPVIGAVMLSVATAILGALASDSTQYNERAAFVQVVQNLNYDKALSHLNSKKIADDPASAYVLCQVAIAKAEKDGKAGELLIPDGARGEALKAQAKKAGEVQTNFVPNGSALYAVESRLLGKATSPIAIQYLEGRERLYSTLKMISRVLGAVTSVFFVLTLGASLLLHLIITRLNRILGLIAPYTYRREEKS